MGRVLVRDVIKFVKVVYRSNFVIRQRGYFLLMEASRKLQNVSSTLPREVPGDLKVKYFNLGFAVLIKLDMKNINELDNC